MMLSHEPGTGLETEMADRSLIAAFEAETRLLARLVELMRRQRAGVANDDVEAVDDSVFAVHRVLHTVAEARRQRRETIFAHTGRDEVGLDELETAFGPAMSPALAEARDRLKRVAQELAAEVEINRHVLKRALSSGEAYVEAIRGGPSPQIGYDAGARSVREAQRSGTLLNRKV